MAKKTLKKMEEEQEELAAAEVAAEVKSAKAEAKVEERNPDFDMVVIEIPIFMKIAGKRLGPGKHTVPRHQARDIAHIVGKKMKADLQALSVTSKSYLVNRALTGAINIKEVDEIKLK